MGDETHTPGELTPEELARQQGEPLPDREVMSTLPIDEAGRFADLELHSDRPPPLDDGPTGDPRMA